MLISTRIALSYSDMKCHYENRKKEEILQCFDIEKEFFWEIY